MSVFIFPFFFHNSVYVVSQQLTTVTNGVVRNQQEGTAADSGKIFPNSHHQQQADVAGSPAIHFKVSKFL